jgi:hypothetical protein
LRGWVGLIVTSYGLDGLIIFRPFRPTRYVLTACGHGPFCCVPLYGPLFVPTVQYMDERAASYTVYLQSVGYLRDIWEPHFNTLKALPRFSNSMATNFVCTCSTVFWVLKPPVVRGYEETAIL